MRCPNCKGSISLVNFLIEKKCPACSETLKRMPTKDQIREFMISFSEDRGYIFWSIVYFLFVSVLAFFEQLTYSGALFDYIVTYKLRFIIISAYAGSIIDYYVKANVEVTAVRNKFIFKPPLYLRNFRRWTNIGLFLGTAFTAYLMYRWPEYIYDASPVRVLDVNVERNLVFQKRALNINSIIPLWTFLTSFVLCLIWSLMGLFLTDDHMNDKRIRYFMEEMRVRRVKYFNRASAIYIGGIFIASVTFYKLVHIQGLWFYIWNSRIVYDTVTFVTQYFGWMKAFAR